MFTGLVECMGVVRSISPDAGDVWRVGIHAPEMARSVLRGESIAVSGACLTAVETSGDVFFAQMMSETLRATRLGALRIGERVNLERALKLGDRLDGHIVQGHVDAVERVTRVEHQGDSRKIWISLSAGIAWGVAPKGSVAVDGVSLTVIDAAADSFSIGLIPTTLTDTTLGSLIPGSPANIEIDAIARYVARLAGFREGGTQADGGLSPGNVLTWDKLQEYGWS